MSSFLADAAKVGATVQGETTFTGFANDIVGSTDTSASGINAILSSRLVPGSVYSNAPESVGAAYKQLLLQGIQYIQGLLVAGGQVAANAHIDSAVLPAWRSAKVHVIAGQGWTISCPPRMSRRCEQILPRQLDLCSRACWWGMQW
ncbi:hypothetical protein BGY98DRAFT_325385 [Russula aff. rugulosa BPL654]|nr:hypothetical protein BGY98DRAFT_325385 [Russula aff. rugulosa BPL654]